MGGIGAFKYSMMMHPQMNKATTPHVETRPELPVTSCHLSMSHVRLHFHVRGQAHCIHSRSTLITRQINNTTIQ
jgi:hypothetical protein